MKHLMIIAAVVFLAVGFTACPSQNHNPNVDRPTIEVGWPDSNGVMAFHATIPAGKEFSDFLSQNSKYYRYQNGVWTLLQTTTRQITDDSQIDWIGISSANLGWDVASVRTWENFTLVGNRIHPTTVIGADGHFRGNIFVARQLSATDYEVCYINLNSWHAWFGQNLEIIVPDGNSNKVIDFWTTDPGNYPTEYVLKTSVSGQGSITPSTPASGSVYESATQVAISATPASGWQFDYFESELGVSTANPDTLTMDRDLNVVAHFSLAPSVQYGLTVIVVGQGTVTGGGSYGVGVTATLTATPAAGWAFQGWSGDLTGSTNPSGVTMNRAKTVTATFVETGTPSTAAVTEFVDNGATGSMRIFTANKSLRSITAADSLGDLPIDADFDDIDYIGVEFVRVPYPYYYLAEYSAGSMAANAWSTTIALDGNGIDGNGNAKFVDLRNLGGGKAIPFYTLRTKPGVMFSINTGAVPGTRNGLALTADEIGYIWN